MKIRQGFVTNSSTTNFVLVNITNVKKTLADFFRESLLLKNFKSSDYNGEFEYYDENDLYDLLSDIQLMPYEVQHFDLRERSEDFEDILYFCIEDNDKSYKTESFIWRMWRD